MRGRLTSVSWTQADLDKLVELARSGVTAVRASVILRRTIPAVQTKARAFGIPFEDSRVARRRRQAMSDTSSGAKPTPPAFGGYIGGKTLGSGPD